MKKLTSRILLGLTMTGGCSTAQAANYTIDTEGAHASVEFKIKHLGYSWLSGRFNTFDGEFSYDSEEPTKSEIQLTIKTKSVDSNHAERDKHIRKSFLESSKYPESYFKSTSFTLGENNSITISGDLTLHGVTKPITLNAKKIGEGEDPWGGYRAGFTGTTSLELTDFKIDTSWLGPASGTIDMTLHIEGIRKQT